MQITDYETGRELRDVGISLTPEEATDMLTFLQRLVREPDLAHVHVSEVGRLRIDKELTLALRGRAVDVVRVA